MVQTAYTVEYGEVGQRDESHPERAEQDSVRFHHIIQTDDVKPVNCSFLEIFTNNLDLWWITGSWNCSNSHLIRCMVCEQTARWVFSTVLTPATITWNISLISFSHIYHHRLLLSILWFHINKIILLVSKFFPNHQNVRFIHVTDVSFISLYGYTSICLSILLLIYMTCPSSGLVWIRPLW